MVNYIEDVNRFKLPTPPEWFMKRLYDYDSALVLIPSRQRVKGETAAYLLCRRRMHTAGIGDVAMLDNKHPDTNMCYQHHLVPIAPLRFNNGASTFTERGAESLIKDLQSRDTWRVTGGHAGNADVLVDQIEAGEVAQKQRERANLRDMFYHKARDAYRSLKARTGQRNKHARNVTVSPRTPQPSQRVTLTDAI